MSEDKITRRDIDDLSARIVITFGLINTAAIAAVLTANAAGATYNVAPFAIGLMSAIVSQIMWYIVSVLEYTFGNFLVFSDNTSNVIWAFLIFFMIIGGGCLSAACIVYGCFILIENDKPMLWSAVICGYPFFIFFFKKKPD